MKKILFCIILFVFVCSCAFCHEHSYYARANGSSSDTYTTYNGRVVKLQTTATSSASAVALGRLDSAYSLKTTYSYTLLGMGSGNSTSNTAYNAYVNSGYKLIYIGGQYYTSTSNSWSESSALHNYLYPSYINYLRPGV